MKFGGSNQFGCKGDKGQDCPFILLFSMIFSEQHSFGITDPILILEQFYKNKYSDIKTATG